MPIRVELDALTPGDFKRILTEPSASLTKQYQALLGTEGLDVEFTPDGIERIAEISGRSTKAPRTSARAACTRSWSGYWKKPRSKAAIWIARW